MKYESKFSIDDVVWMVRDTRFSRIIKCSACKNTGKIKIAEEEYICPKCGGRAAHEQYAGQKFYVHGSSGVDQVRIEHTDARSRYHAAEPNPKFQYMLYDTGVGTGQIWEEERLFASEEEAQRFCDGHNGILLAHEAVMLPSPVDSFGRVIANGDSKSEGT